MTSHKACFVLTLAVTAALAVAGCSKSVAQISGNYRSDNRSFEMHVQTSSAMSMDVGNTERQVTYTQNGTNLKITSADRRSPQFTMTAEVIDDGNAIQWDDLKTDNGKVSSWDHKRLSKVLSN
ncbi:hypothetical protein [Dyella sp. S184]|uniref:hypothetical protein n=1 Tax=Dyella sp. S184 TaxID=1641862 RepID=UPI00131E09C7|nr:hypothetical protein [Dyella sp. S184]